MSSNQVTENPFVPNQEGIVSAVITNGIITYDDDNAKVKNEPKLIYTDAQLNNKYEKDRHIYMLGMTSPGGFQGASVAFVQLAAPTLLWISRWTLCSFFSQPKSPNPISNNPDWILMDDHYEPGTVIVGPDGVTPLYRISGTYVYGHRNPAEVTVNNINFARPPWLEDAFDRSMPESKLQQDLINGTGQGASQGVNASFPSASPGVI